MGGSSSYACSVGINGRATSAAPTGDWVRPLPCFLIG